MVEPLRFLQGGGNAWERELLASTLHDKVPSESRARVASGLGLAATAALAAPAPARMPSFALGPISKWTLLGLAGGLALLAGMRAWSAASAVAVSTGAPPAADTVLSAPGADPSATPAAPIVERTAPDPTQPSAASLRAPKVSAPRHAPRRDPAARAEAAAGADRLIAEVRQLDRARSALRSSQGQLALSLLDEYATAFPGGTLTLEATVLRVRALSESGDRATAARLARKTLAAPGSERYRADLERVIALDTLK